MENYKKSYIGDNKKVIKKITNEITRKITKILQKKKL